MSVGLYFIWVPQFIVASLNLFELNLNTGYLSC